MDQGGGMDGLGPWNAVEAMGRSETVLLCLCLLAVVAGELSTADEQFPEPAVSSNTQMHVFYEV